MLPSRLVDRLNILSSLPSLVLCRVVVMWIHRDAECLGLHDGDPQLSNLGDGNGPKGEREVLREHYSLPIIGTCLESLIGGNHLRTYVQNGPEANSGALFLA